MITIPEPSTIAPAGDARAPAIFRRLLVALGEPGAGPSLVDFAVALAARHRSEVVFCNVVDHAGAIASCSTGAGASLLAPLVEALDDASSSILVEAVAAATAAAVTAYGIEADGRPVRAILACARAHGADAIVLATAGKRGLRRAMLGSTTDGVLRESPLPVVVLPPRASSPGRAFGRVFVALDESRPSELAAAFGALLANAENARLALCTVVDAQNAMAIAAEHGLDPIALVADMRSGAARHAAAELARIGGDPARREALVVDGEPATALMHAADGRGADCVVIGSHGRKGFRRLLAGSVAEALVRRSRVPVVVVRAPLAGRPDAHVARVSREQVRA